VDTRDYQPEGEGDEKYMEKCNKFIVEFERYRYKYSGARLIA